jgi:hypothetical protein
MLHVVYIYYFIKCFTVYWRAVTFKLATCHNFTIYFVLTSDHLITVKSDRNLSCLWPFFNDTLKVNDYCRWCRYKIHYSSDLYHLMMLSCKKIYNKAILAFCLPLNKSTAWHRKQCTKHSELVEMDLRGWISWRTHRPRRAFVVQAAEHASLLFADRRDLGSTWPCSVHLERSAEGTTVQFSSKCVRMSSYCVVRLRSSQESVR